MSLSQSVESDGNLKINMRIMTFNIRFGTAKDGENEWCHRQGILTDMLRQTQPHILCTQEGMKFQLEHIKSELPRLNYLGIGRYEGAKVRREYELLDSEHCALFYDTTRFEPEKHQTFWLSDTPEIPGSCTWGNDMARIVTWAIFNDLYSEKRFAVFNTHFHWGDEIVQKSAELVADRVRTISPDLPVFLSGDFNLKPDSAVHRFFTDDTARPPERRRLKDCWRECGKAEEGAGTWHNFTGTAADRIDWILVSEEISPMSIQRVTYNLNGRYPSDHFPVMAEVEL
ncbi:endonuclease/exonuclease/phosphatase family protein [candidate division KSB1 bacterium]|nr:endonuclease/exonuclease/phosphatase family protein [candidate division KSB1 bacterium]